MIKLIGMLSIVFAIIACSQLKTSDDSDWQQVHKAGIINIKFQTEPLKNLRCGDGIESKYFTGETNLGQPIGGVLCKGILKQTTLRF